jgi:hypothetical protein
VTYLSPGNGASCGRLPPTHRFHSTSPYSGLVNQRVIRQILSQAFFFGAYATLLNASKEAKNVLFESEQTLLLWLIPTAALFAEALTYMGILSSLKTVVYLRQLYDDHVDSQATHNPSSKRYPGLFRVPCRFDWAHAFAGISANRRLYHFLASCSRETSACMVMSASASANSLLFRSSGPIPFCFSF